MQEDERPAAALIHIGDACIEDIEVLEVAVVVHWMRGSSSLVRAGS